MILQNVLKDAKTSNITLCKMEKVQILNASVKMIIIMPLNMDKEVAGRKEEDGVIISIKILINEANDDIYYRIF